MSQHPSGWYDDPSSPDQLRYWDGVSWTNHTTPRKSPTASQSTIALPQQTQQGQAGQVPQAGGWAGQSQQQGKQAPQQVPQQGQQQGQQGYYQAPGDAQWMRNIPTTVDGVPLSSWGKRLAAWLIDGVIILVVGGLLAWTATPRLGELFSAMFTAAEAQDQAKVLDLQTQLSGPAVQFSIVLWLFTTAYCLIFWTTTGQTPGKMALGISVRRAAQPGPLPVGTALLRRLVPLAGQFVPFLSLLDGLWPLWDGKRQALHDKVASTQVVEGKQPRKHG